MSNLRAADSFSSWLLNLAGRLNLCPGELMSRASLKSSTESLPPQLLKAGAAPRGPELEAGAPCSLLAGAAASLICQGHRREHPSSTEDFCPDLTARGPGSQVHQTIGHRNASKLCSRAEAWGPGTAALLELPTPGSCPSLVVRSGTSVEVELESQRPCSEALGAAPAFQAKCVAPVCTEQPQVWPWHCLRPRAWPGSWD